MCLPGNLENQQAQQMGPNDIRTMTPMLNGTYQMQDGNVYRSVPDFTDQDWGGGALPNSQLRRSGETMNQLSPIEKKYMDAQVRGASPEELKQIKNEFYK